MESNEKIVEILNDLVQINNDRIEGYERAAQETEDSDLKSLFHQMSEKSHMLKSQLGSEVVKRGGKPTESTTASGKVFRVWMDFKAALTGKNRKLILRSCEFGEDAAQDTYKSALESSDKLPADIVQLVSDQKSKLREDHDHVKALRDSVHA